MSGVSLSGAVEERQIVGTAVVPNGIRTQQLVRLIEDDGAEPLTPRLRGVGSDVLTVPRLSSRMQHSLRAGVQRLR